MTEPCGNKPESPVPTAGKRRFLRLVILLVPVLLVILTGVMLLGIVMFARL